MNDNLTEHIDLPDPARGPVMLEQLLQPQGWELYQYAYSNWTVVHFVRSAIGDYRGRQQAEDMAAELNMRMAVAKELSA